MFSKMLEYVRVVLLVMLVYCSAISTDKNKAQKWLDEYNIVAERVYFKYSTAAWIYNTNITAYNSEALVNESLALAEFKKAKCDEANALFDWQNITNDLIRREFSFITDIGTSALLPNEVKEVDGLLSTMQGIYSTGKVCKFGMICEEGSDDNKVPLDPDITEKMSKSRNYEELLYYWQSWHDTVGRVMRKDYKKFVELSNKAAQINGYVDTGDYWRRKYESDEFEQEVLDILKEVMPFFKKLHAYVRHKLGLWYGESVVHPGAPLPVHLLGDMWAQTWGNIYDMVEPFSGEQPIDVTDAMVEQGYDVRKIFEVSEDFFTSLGLIPMPWEFWNKTMYIRPTDGREVNCHGSAWDFKNGIDYRIMQCTEVNMPWLSITHHEMGHTEYDLQYKDQPVVFRDGANPGFHEAIGDLMSLSVETPKHLHKIGLLDEVYENYAADINFLMKKALDNVPFLPSAYHIDAWRWNVFNGSVTHADWNKHWWDLRCSLQGVKSDIPRTEEHFDPGAKYHVPNNYPYISYFVSFIIKFQFHKALCETAGHTGPLHTCDIYKSTEAGTQLSNALKLGASKPWQDVMEQLTGQRDMLSSGILDYFAPLMEWLDEYILANGIKVGWSCSEDEEARLWLDKYNEEASEALYKKQLASWTYKTNITEDNLQNYIAAKNEMAEFDNRKGLEARAFNLSSLTDGQMKRQFKKIVAVGYAALPDDEVKQLNTVLGNMSVRYSTGKICEYGKMCSPDSDENKIPLSPDVTRIFAKSRDYDELLHYWQGWHDNVGASMKKDFAEYVRLSNKAAVLDGFENYGEYWRRDYESETFVDDVAKLMDNLMPLYQRLHTYMRYKLGTVYGVRYVNQKGPIAAHLLGNMWAQQWSNLLDLVEPFPGAQTVDVTNEMVAQGYTAQKMFNISEDFFTSLGLIEMPQEFWEETMMVKPDNRKVVCHASAYDFYNRKDFRIKQCTEITHRWLTTTHHEMGHVEYYLQYKDQPVKFRRGANPGFHEAIGDLMSLSVDTPKHLHLLGLLHELEDNYEADMNFLMRMALNKIAFLPFGYLIDQWRWSVFEGKTGSEQYNEKWWDLRCNLQGVQSAFRRTEGHFDPGAKYHVPNNVPYIRYFVAFVIQFQFHKALCDEAGHVGPYHKCDIYNSTEAGEKLAAALRLGSSRPWPEAMKLIAGQEAMDVSALMDYFEPLTEWLDRQIEQHSLTVGWNCSETTSLFTVPAINDDREKVKG